MAAAVPAQWFGPSDGTWRDAWVGMEAATTSVSDLEAAKDIERGRVASPKVRFARTIARLGREPILRVVAEPEGTASALLADWTRSRPANPRRFSPTR